jgi:excisionase family DNA binding protein
MIFNVKGCAIAAGGCQDLSKPPAMALMRNTNASPLGLSTSQAAQALGVSLGTIRRWSDMGYLQSYRTPGGQRRFSQEQINTFLGSLEQQGVDPLLQRKSA